MRKTATLIVSVLALSACGGEAPDNGPGQPVAHRRAAFKEIIKAFEPMGVMLRTDRFDANQFLAWTRQVMAVRNGPWEYFKPGTQYPPSHATDAVWANPEKFAAEKKAFFDATEKLAAAAETRDQEKANAAYKAVQDTCKNCHETFKTR